MKLTLRLIALILLSPMMVSAKDIVLKAGSWHLQNISTHPLIGRKEKTKDRCFDEALVSNLAADPNRLLGDQKQQCETTQFTRKGNYLSWQVKCDEKLTLSGNVEVWLDSATSFHGKGTMKSDGIWPPGELKSEFSGVWADNCAASAQ
ncbi:DUF3617 domain-containing protein [Leeia sp. TBRC 13508]|uniref:DUF3617 domain-containing protein n=1 Tax=Leeia speluncae TaxID=2884804 RepID=A0ABS8D866_9NEIS|nr:DUF3617 family protein [Leeia speluncae]MCB6184371.1 DUF3617 domain-containing protein [Leeia speluncae]